MRKALVVGLNDYPTAPLRGCKNDAIAIQTILETHGNGDPNFDVRLHTDITSKGELLGFIESLFKSEDEAALFYFSGHGYENERGGFLVTPDLSKNDVGVSMTDLLLLANESKAKNRIIILDCCHSGAAGTVPLLGKTTANINTGVTILTSSKFDEASMEVHGHGVFTSLLIDALRGGATDILGNTTPGSIYSYIDQALGSWEQRPVFKTNITEFISLRDMEPKVPKEYLRNIIKYFPTPEFEYSLDPSFEDQNNPNTLLSPVKPYSDPSNVAIFKQLQKFQSVGLVTPVDAPFMFFAAMESKSCRLTALGAHYWRLVKSKRL